MLNKRTIEKQLGRIKGIWFQPFETLKQGWWVYDEDGLLAVIRFESTVTFSLKSHREDEFTWVEVEALRSLFERCLAVKVELGDGLASNPVGVGNG